MKFAQTDNQIIITQSGTGQIVIGAVFGAIGLGLAGFGISGKAASTNQAQNQSHAGVWVTGIGLLFLACGIGATLSARNQRVTIVRGGTTDISSSRALGGRPKLQSIPTNTITKVSLVTYQNRTGSSGDSGRRSSLMLILQDGSQITVADKGGTNINVNGLAVGSFMKAPLANEAQQLATYLGVPLDAEDMSTFAGAVRTATKVIGEQLNPAQTPPISLPNTSEPTPIATTQDDPPQPPTRPV